MVTHNTNIAIYISSEQLGLYISIGNYLIENSSCNVVFLSKDENIKEIASTKTSAEVVSLDQKSIYTNNKENIIEKAIIIEEKFNITLSQLMSEDRGLGQGYLFNVQKVPTIKRANFPYSKKLKILLNEIISIEAAISSYNVDILIQQFPKKTRNIVARYFNVKTYSLASARYGDRYFWSDDDYITSSLFISNILSNIDNNYRGADNPGYEILNAAEMLNKAARFDYISAIKRAVFLIFNDIKKLLTNRLCDDSYKIFGWVPSVFRKVSNYKYVNKIGITPEDVQNFNIIYFPLHLEPEVSLLYFSPEFTNSMEAITWLSKSVPANTVIVVKEQLYCYGVRSLWYYEQLNKISNVFLSQPDIHAWEWINASKVVSTITGTAGTEAVYKNKYVISYGKHQIINNLPTVFYASDYQSTKDAIDKINNNTFDLSVSRHAYHNALIESTIELEEYKNTYHSISEHKKMAIISLQSLSKIDRRVVLSSAKE
jgi:hypothetical protein